MKMKFSLLKSARWGRGETWPDALAQTSLTDNRDSPSNGIFPQTQRSTSWIQKSVKIHTADAVTDCHKGKSEGLLNHHAYTLPPGSNRQHAVSSSNSQDVIDLLFIFH